MEGRPSNPLRSRSMGFCLGKACKFPGLSETRVRNANLVPAPCTSANLYARMTALSEALPRSTLCAALRTPRDMKSRRTFLVAVFFLLLFSAAPRTKTIVIATSAVVLTNTPYWVGIDRKFFDDAGLSVQYLVMRSALAGQGLI